MASGDRIQKHDLTGGYLHKFKLYETRSNFYIVGRDKNRAFWRVLKIDRLELSELNILEDSTTYSEHECCDLLKRIHEGNRSIGGLKFVTTCYGIVGFIKFLGPYYMMLITKRRKIGAICGHAIYTITKSEMIPIPNSTVLSNMDNSKNDNRYKKLLRTVDLTKDFFFSYSYQIMHSLQKNLCDNEAGQLLYETMFVWNEFLTRVIRNHLKNTLWTVALVHGFFNQAKLSISGRDFLLTLIARRSRHFAGTRYLKRGVNEKGQVANDVETEQIVFEDVLDGCPTQISSVVQNRGSIPLFWSQETSRLNIKPDIILSRKDYNYEATRLHFETLVKRYGNPIIILNLIKTREKKPREIILRTEFANAIEFINKDLSAENRLRFLHWDLSYNSKNKSISVLELLGKVAVYAIDLTDIFYCHITPTLSLEEQLNLSNSEENDGSECTLQDHCNKNKDADHLEREIIKGNGDASGHCAKTLRIQKGVLRTNCIDCLDRTNVAQYAFGLVALGHQLHALGLMDVPNVDLDSPLADDLMGIYETMGDTLALQYGGSAAHNKIFSERRGQWKAATQSQELFRTIQRYCSNAYMDARKQDAINLFLGNFQPQQDKPALWELDLDQHYNVGRRGSCFANESPRSIMKRSLSDGNILFERDSSVSAVNIEKQKTADQPLADQIRENKGLLDSTLEMSTRPFPNKMRGNKGFLDSTLEMSNRPLPDQMRGNKGLSDSTPEMSTCGTDLSYSRYTPSIPRRHFFTDLQQNLSLESSEHNSVNEHGDSSDYSNFLDVEWLSSSGNSCEEETYESFRSALIHSPTTTLSLENVVTGVTATDASESGSSMKGEEPSDELAKSSGIPSEFPDSFVQWVTNGGLFFN